MAQLTSRWGRRTAATLATTSLVVAGLGFVAGPANAHPAGDRATSAGATWLKGQLTNGLVVGEYTGMDGAQVKYDDYGLSADFALALKAVGGNDATVTKIADAVAPGVTNWYDSYGTVYTGSAAKAAVLAQIAGKDATNFGGQNLVDVVEDRTATTAPIVGRVQNDGEFDYQPPFGPVDSLNVISQGFAARALTTAGSAKAADVTAFLLDQQCAAGFFRGELTTDKAASEQGCVAGDVANVDTTALTVINILDTTGASAAAKTAAASAIAWLKTQQASDGSFSSVNEGVNANTTGLAGWALTKAGETAAATKAAGWLRGVQIADIAPCTTTLAAENGAIAYKPTVLTSTRTAGSIKVAQRDQFRRSTAQALPALASVPAATGALGISAPPSPVELSTVTVTVTGLGAGEVGCVSFRSVVKPVVGTGSPVTVNFDLPAGSVVHTFTLNTLAGTQTAVVTSVRGPVPPKPPTPTPTPTPEAGKLTVAKVEKVKNNKFTLEVSCDAKVACDGKIAIRTARKVIVGNAKRARKVLIVKDTYTVEPGTTEKIVLEVRRPAGKVLDAADGKIKVRAVQTAKGANGAKPAVTKFWLRNK